MRNAGLTLFLIQIFGETYRIKKLSFEGYYENSASVSHIRYRIRADTNTFQKCPWFLTVTPQFLIIFAVWKPQSVFNVGKCLYQCVCAFVYERACTFRGDIKINCQQRTQNNKTLNHTHTRHNNIRVAAGSETAITLRTFNRNISTPKFTSFGGGEKIASKNNYYRPGHNKINKYSGAFKYSHFNVFNGNFWIVVLCWYCYYQNTRKQ